MKTIIGYTFIVVFLCTASGWAQFSDQAALEEVSRSQSLGMTPVVRPSGLIDLSRLRWSHSYSLSYYSGSGYSGSMGLLNTTVFYELSSKLSLALNLGIAHNVGAVWGDGRNNATFLPGFLLDYHPSEKIRLSVQMRTYRYNGGYFIY